jgi:hypothetical protein
MLSEKTLNILKKVVLITIFAIAIIVMVRTVRRTLKTARRRKTRHVRDNFQNGGSNLGKVYVFYHVFCNEHAMPIVKDQVMKILFSGLYKTVDAIYVFLTGNEQIINEARAFIEKCGKKFILEAPGVNDTTYERYTLTKIKAKIKPEDKFLYLHDKGTTRAGQENVYWWRTWMEYHTMVRHKECIELLNTHDVVGNIINSINGKHFAGNFWWCRGDYYLKMPEQIGLGYYDPETYILKGQNPRTFELGKEDTKPEENFYGFGVIPSIYMDRN